MRDNFEFHSAILISMFKNNKIFAVCCRKNRFFELIS